MSHLGSHLGRLVGAVLVPSPFAPASTAIQWQQIQSAIKAWVVGGSRLATDHVIWADLKGPRPSTPYIELALTTIVNPAHDWTSKAPNPLVFADKIISSVDTGANKLVSAAHDLVTGDGPVRISQTGGALPSPLMPATDYWIIAVDGGNLRLAATYDDTGGNDPTMLNAITPIVLTTTGSGTIKISKTSDTVRAGQELKRSALGVRMLVLMIEVFGPEGSGLLPMAIAHDVIASMPFYVDALDAAGVGTSDVGVPEIEGDIRSVGGKLGGIEEPRAQVELFVFVSSQLDGTLARVDRVNVTSRAELDDGTLEDLGSTWMPSPPP